MPRNRDRRKDTKSREVTSESCGQVCGQACGWGAGLREAGSIGPLMPHRMEGGFSGN